jgi:hypothetical protein
MPSPLHDMAVVTTSKHGERALPRRHAEVGKVVSNNTHGFRRRFSMVADSKVEA